MSEPTKVKVLTGGFVVKPSQRMYYPLQSYLIRMYRFEFNKKASRRGGSIVYETKREMKDKWCVELEDLNEYRIHISYLDEFKEHFKTYDVEYSMGIPNYGDEVEFGMMDWYEPREGQQDWIDFLTKPHPNPHLALGASMGGGKSVTFLASISKLKRRACMIIPPFLSDRWLLEALKFTTLTKKEIVYISGGPMLKSYMTTIEMGRNPFKLVLISINTLRNYYRDYYLYPDEWIYSPEDFFYAANFGIRGIDEAHKELHFHFITTLFLNLNHYIGLSGTLGKENEFLDGMAERLFPLESRVPINDVVASTEASIYKLFYGRWIPKHKSSMGYSHIMYENDIRYHPSIKEAYFLQLARITKVEFADITVEDEDKCVIFFATIKLADDFCEFLSDHEPLQKDFGRFRIGRLRAGEPDDKTKELDIVITTVGRCGTGTDIPGILTVFNTISISDGFLQRQVLGRARKRPDINCRYVRLYSTSIRKHVDYHLKSLGVLKDLCTKVTIRNLSGTMHFPTGWDFEQAKKTEGMERLARNLKKKKNKAKRKSKKRG